MLIAYKFQLKPNKEQTILINKHIGCCRLMYNYILSEHKNAYKEDKSIKWNRYKYQNLIPSLKKSDKYNFLKEVNSQSLQCAIMHLDKAYQNYFSGRTKEPTFHSKKKKQSFHIPQSVKVKDCKLYIPKFKCGININQHREIIGDIKNATIERSKSNKYYVSIIVENGIDNEEMSIDDIKDGIGIDLGIKDFAILSTGEKIDNPRYFVKSQKKLKRLQRKHSRKVKNSNNRAKSRLKIARLHEHVANQRKDFQHKITKKIASDNQISFVCIEDLNVKGLIRNRKLSKAISDVSWGQFRTLLEYKCKIYQKLLIKIGRFVPSSKNCSHCGYKNMNLTLSDRYWDCPCCGKLLDRDINAAINIKNEGINIINIKYRTLGTSGSYACGDSVRRLDRTQLSSKQEAPRL